MPNRTVSFETYCKRNINHAVKGLPKGVADQIKRSFKAARCADIYGGELETYLGVIAQTLERKNETVRELKARTEAYTKELNKVINIFNK